MSAHIAHICESNFVFMAFTVNICHTFGRLTMHHDNNVKLPYILATMAGKFSIVDGIEMNSSQEASCCLASGVLLCSDGWLD